METKKRRKSEGLPAGFRDRLEQAADADGRAKTVISQIAGARNSLVDVLAGTTKNPTLATVYNLARVLGVSVDWLLTGRGPRDLGAVRVYPVLEQLIADQRDPWPEAVLIQARGLLLPAGEDLTTEQWRRYLDAEEQALRTLTPQVLGEVAAPPIGEDTP